MARTGKALKKFNPLNAGYKTNRNESMHSKDKSSSKKNILQHLVHPDYVLFDWEFFSNQLEFE